MQKKQSTKHLENENSRRKTKDEAKTDILDKYKYLIGVCFNARSNATYKITSIEDR